MYDYSSRVSREFPSEEALKNYLRDHPKAKPGNHSVKPKGEGKPKTPEAKPESKPEAKPSAPAAKADDTFKKTWENALRNKLDREPTQDDFDILKGQMKHYVQTETKKLEEKGLSPKAPEKKEPKKADPSDPFVKSWGKTIEQQTGHPLTEDEVDIWKAKFKTVLQRGKLASSTARVVFRYLVAR